MHPNSCFINENDADKIIPILKNDDGAEIEKMVLSYSNGNIIVDKYTDETPKCLRNKAYLVDHAAYYSSVKCLEFLLGYIDELRTDDSLVYFFNLVFFFIFSFNSSFCCL